MVDVKVFTDQLDEKHLDKATEAKIRKLLKNAKIITQQQASILQRIIDGELSNLSKINTLEQLQIAAGINIFTTSAATEALIPYQNNIGKMFQFGIKFSSAKMSETALLLEEGVKQSTQLWLTKMGDDLKKQAGDIVADGLKKGLDRNTVVAQMEQNLNISRARANSIARTETMRAAHAGSYAQAIRDGKQYYIIDSRAEFCKLCQRKFSGEVFDIDNPGPMPPAHPNCACIPIYFDDMDTATRWATKIDNDINKQRKQLEDKGLTIKDDGTGTEVNKLNPKKRLKN